jgi:hypothetical protein
MHRLERITALKVNAILDSMPKDWLQPARRSKFVTWWESPQRQDKLTALRSGFADGTLL